MKFEMKILLIVMTLVFGAFSQQAEIKFFSFLIDSNFTVKSIIESEFQEIGEPDSLSIIKAGIGNIGWRFPVLNPTPVEGAWLVYEPPMDPGKIAIVSNTNPPVALIRFYIDAMSAGAFHRYEFNGMESKVNAEPSTTMAFSPKHLDNIFDLGDTLSEIEADILSKIPFPENHIQTTEIPQLVVLNLSPPIPEIPNFNPDGIKYLAYFSIMKQESNSVVGIFKPETPYILLNRNILGQRISIQRKKTDLILLK